MIMKTILSTLVALSVLAGVAASTAQAADFGSRGFWVERDANQN
jgi:Ni/Co efflux regulator RcnB